MEIEIRVRTFIERHALLQPGEGVLVALSGGADSVALLRVLLCLGYDCHAVHCNFHLRGEESNRDEAFVVELCRSLGVPCEVVHFDTGAYAARQKISIEMAARDLRYREFERIRASHALQAVAVAHHRDDAVETVLLNLIRGAGINGLTGMRVKNGRVVRPLLCLSREEVLGYLDALGQPYVTDSTNLTDAYARNKVRLQLLPLMQQINPAAKENILQAASHLADAAAIYNKVMEGAVQQVVRPCESGIDVDVASLMAADVPQALLFEILHPYGFNSRQVADVFRSLRGEPGRMFHAPDYVALKDREILCVRQRESAADDVPVVLPEEGTLMLPDGRVVTVCRLVPDSSWHVPREREVCVLDASRLSVPLVLRHPKEGDRMRPFGMRGTKLLSDLYTDLKLSRMERDRQWLLCHGDEVVWAVGQRAGEQCRLHGDETEVIVVTVR